MGQLTRERAIKEHRRMWLWLAQDILNKKSKPFKTVDYYTMHQLHIFKDSDISIVEFGKRSGNFICMYQHQKIDVFKQTLEDLCRDCPIDWGNASDKEYFKCILNCNPMEEYIRCRYNDWETAARCAYEIAMLPEKKD